MDVIHIHLAVDQCLAAFVLLRYFGGRWAWLQRSSATPSKSKKSESEPDAGSSTHYIRGTEEGDTCSDRARLAARKEAVDRSLSTGRSSLLMDWSANALRRITLSEDLFDRPFF
jgi:hypothetical protein